MLVESQIGGITVYVDAVTGPGTQKTSSRTEVAERLNDMFVRAQGVIEQMALEIIDMREKLASHAHRPDQLEIQFGVKFTTQGQIIFASAAAEASLAIKIIYGNGRPDTGDTVTSNDPSRQEQQSA